MTNFDINKPLMLHDGTPVKLREGKPRLGSWYNIEYENGGVPDFNVFTERGLHFDDQCPPLRNRPEEMLYDNEFVSGEELELQVEQLRAWKAAAVAKYPDLAPVDPYLKRAREILATVVDQSDGDDIINGDWDGEYSILGVIRALKEGMGDERPYTLTTEELAEWRLKEAREIVANNFEIRNMQSYADSMRAGECENWPLLRMIVATLNKYNIKPEVM